jgi:hypothetical protein
MTTKGVLPANLDRAEKGVLREREADITTAILDLSRCRVAVGQALWDIDTEKLWRGEYDNLADYGFGRWGISRSNTYRLVKLAKFVAANPTLPIPAQWELEPGKVAKKAQKALGAAQSNPTDGTPAVIDARSSEIPAPVAEAVDSEARDACSADSPEAPTIGLEDNGASSSGGEAEQGDSPSLEAPAPAVTAQSPDRSPVVVADAKTAIEAADGPDDAWSAENVAPAIAEIDRLPRPADIDPSDSTKCPHCPYDGVIVGSHAEGCEWVAAQVYRQTGIAISPMTGAVALINLLQSLDLDALGATLTANQMDTLTKAYEQIAVAYSNWPPSVPKPRKAAAKKVAPVKAAAKGQLEWVGNGTTDGRFGLQSEQARGEQRFYWLMISDPDCAAAYKTLDLDGSTDKRTVMRQAQRVADLVAKNAKSAAKDTGGCDHPKVAGHPAKTRGKWACGLCNQ